MGSSNSFNVVSLIIAFILLINFGAFALVLSYGVINDYMLYTVVDVADDLGADGTLPASFVQSVKDVANKFKDTFQLYDNILFVFWLMFSVAIFYLSYGADQENYFTFFGTLFFVGLVFLMFIGLFVTFSDWWHTSILVNLLPSFNAIFPKYGWVLSNLGIISAVQLAICLVLNQFDFDFANMFSRKKKEQTVLDNEVL
jgi:hypothetical protein